MSEILAGDAAIVPRVDVAKDDNIGIFGKLQRSFFGKKAAVLTEEKIHVHWLTLVTMAMVSFFGVQIFASSSFEKALHGDFTSAVIVITIIGAIVISDYAAPMAREMSAMERMRHDDRAATMLMWYAYLVYFADGYTCIEGLYRDALNIPSTTPTSDFFGIPNSGLFLELGIRGCLIIATLWTIHDVTKKRLPTSYTLASQGAGILGGELLQRITRSDANGMSMAQLLDQFFAFSDISKRSPKNRKQEIEEKRMMQAQEKLQTILTTDTKQSVQAVASMSSEIASLTSAVSELLQQLKDGMLSTPKKSKGTTNASNETGYKAMLSALDITPVTSVYRVDSSGKKETKSGVALRGGWINSAGIVALSDGQCSKDDATILARSLGQGYKFGTMYACPLPAVLKALDERNKLHSTVQEYLLASTKATDTTDQ